METNNLYLLNNRINALNKDVYRYIIEMTGLNGPNNFEEETEELFLTFSFANYKITKIYMHDCDCYAEGINQHNGFKESNLELTDEHYQSIVSYMARISSLDKHSTHINSKTIKFTVPRYKADLYISLFYADGGDGFSDDEIKEAESFITENNLSSLVEVSEERDGMVECTFTIN